MDGFELRRSTASELARRQRKSFLLVHWGGYVVDSHYYDLMRVEDEEGEEVSFEIRAK